MGKGLTDRPEHQQRKQEHNKLRTNHAKRDKYRPAFAEILAHSDKKHLFRGVDERGGGGDDESQRGDGGKGGANRKNKNANMNKDGSLMQSPGQSSSSARRDFKSDRTICYR